MGCGDIGDIAVTLQFVTTDNGVTGKGVHPPLGGAPNCHRVPNKKEKEKMELSRCAKLRRSSNPFNLRVLPRCRRLRGLRTAKENASRNILNWEIRYD